jgi:hypothetical protein
MIAGELSCHRPTATAPWGLPECRAGAVLQTNGEGGRCQLSAYSHDDLSRLCILTRSRQPGSSGG